VFVYGLYSTRNNEVRYIGETDNLQARLINHRATARSGKELSVKAEWIRKEEKAGHQIECIILAKNARPHTDEQRMIDAFHLVLGERLLNTKHGHWQSCRVKEGIARARAEGRVPGRKPIEREKLHRVLAHIRAGVSMHKTAKAVGVGVGTVYRAKEGMIAGKYDDIDTTSIRVEKDG
jgi:hypothetical protein